MCNNIVHKILMIDGRSYSQVLTTNSKCFTSLHIDHKGNNRSTRIVNTQRMNVNAVFVNPSKVSITSKASFPCNWLLENLKVTKTLIEHIQFFSCCANKFPFLAFMDHKDPQRLTDMDHHPNCSRGRCQGLQWPSVKQWHLITGCQLCGFASHN